MAGVGDALPTEPLTDRPADAGEIAATVRDWLEGARRRAEAARRLQPERVLEVQQAVEQIHAGISEAIEEGDASEAVHRRYRTRSVCDVTFVGRRDDGSVCYLNQCTSSIYNACLYPSTVDTKI